MMSRLSLVVVAFLAFFQIQAAFALPLPSPGATPFGPEVSNAKSSDVTIGVNFIGIVALSNCSGSIVRFDTSLGTDKAIVLTNGHCLNEGFVPAGQAIVNKPSARNFRILSADGRTVLGTIRSTMILYGTMTGTDMALYQIEDTYDQIEKKYQTPALVISRTHPVASRSIAVISGYWKKIYSCAIDDFVYQLREDKWTWNDSIRYTAQGCQVIGGTSGSPVVDTETLQVVGVNNTGNESGGRCTMNNPCEVDASGNITVRKNASYGEQTYWIYGCLTADNMIDLSTPGCELTKPTN